MKTLRSRTYNMIGVCVLTFSAVVSQAQAQDAAQNPTIGDAPIASVEAAPTLITLQMKDAAPQAIVDAFVAQAKAAGVDVSAPTDLEGGPTSINIDKQQIWAALRTLALRLDLTAEPSYSSMRGNRPVSLLTNSKLRQSTRDSYARSSALLRGPISGNQQFVIVADGATHNSFDTVKFGIKAPTEGRDTLTLQFAVYAAPALLIVPNSATIKLDEATDEAGASILAPPAVNSAYFYSPSGSSGSNFISLSAPLSPNAGKRVARLKGTLRARIATKTQTWTVPDVLNARDAVLVVTKPDCIERYIVEKVERPEANQVQVRVRVERTLIGDAPPEPQNVAERMRRMRGERFNSPDDMVGAITLTLMDADGRELRRNGSSSQSSGSLFNREGQKLSAQFRYSRLPNGPESLTGEAAKLVWEIPVEFREVEVPFTFSDLPLP